MSANAGEFVDAVRDDRDHVWHHITQHKPMAAKDPLVIVETIQEICRRYGILLHLHEVVCGLGRV